MKSISDDTMSPTTERARRLALAHIANARNELLAAAQAACDLQGWAKQWREIGDKADEVQALWHTCNRAPLPTGHDYEKTGGQP